MFGVNDTHKRLASSFFALGNGTTSMSIGVEVLLLFWPSVCVAACVTELVVSASSVCVSASAVWIPSVCVCPCVFEHFSSSSV